ncbi:MAG: ACT domain-containing protein [Comamonadaceae bacterium]|nr:MAG: ACT domain-containing protein [Comamonadaceae bacterium]
MTPAKSITLQPLPGGYAIARLGPDSPLPAWADGPGFVSITRTADELSITCLEHRVPVDAQADRGWRALRFVGPFAFGETGIILSVIRPLSEHGIGVFVVSTFDGDHLLIQQADGDRAMALLRASGHVVLPESPATGSATASITT